MTGDRPRIILFRGHSLYDSVNTMVAELALAVGRQGCRPEVVDLRCEDARDRIVSLVREGAVGRFLCVNGLGLPATAEDCRLYRETGVPVVLYALDHPIGLYPCLQLPLPTLVATVPTRHNVDVCREVIRRDLRCYHLPHGAARPTSRLRPWRLRDVPLLLSASLQQPPEAARADWRRYGPVTCARLNAMVETHEADPARPLDQVIGSVLNAPGSLGSSAGPDLHELFSCFSLLDGFLRNRLRERLVAACRRLPLTVCGSGWSADGAGASRFLGPRPVHEVFALMARAKIVLNPLPPYYQSHERPLQAMARGAVAATPPMPWFTPEPGEDPLIPLSDDVEESVAGLTAALADDASLEARARAGHDAFLAGHTWDHRARSLLSL